VARLLPLELVGGAQSPDRTETKRPTMKSTTVAAHATENRPNRILVALAAAWMILSLAIGGAVTADNRESSVTDTITSVTATQP